MKHALLILALVTACSSSADTVCKTACADGSVCSSGVCRVTCISSAQCGPEETCFGGVCAESSATPGALVLPEAGLMDLDFTSTTLPSTVTFARSTSATTLDANTLVARPADSPRLERNPRFGTPLGLVIEPAAENLCLGSAQLDDPTWWWTARTNKQADAARAPDQTNTATRLSPDEAYDYHSSGQPFWTTDAQAYTFSMFVKAGELDSVYVGVGGRQGYPVQLVDLATGTLSQNNGATTLSNAGIIDVGDGWYRTWVVFTNAVLGQNLNTILELGLLQPDASRGLYAWGCQLEVGSAVTSYTPAGAESGKRAADSVTVTRPEDLDLGQDFTLLILQAVDSNAKAESVGIAVAIDGGNELRLGRGAEGNGFVMVVESAAAFVPVNLTAGEVWRVGEPHAIALSKRGESLTLVDNGAVARGGYGNLDGPATAIRIGQRLETPTAPARVYRVVIWQRAFDEATLVKMTTP